MPRDLRGGFVLAILAACPIAFGIILRVVVGDENGADGEVHAVVAGLDLADEGVPAGFEGGGDGSTLENGGWYSSGVCE